MQIEDKSLEVLESCQSIIGPGRAELWWLRPDIYTTDFSDLIPIDCYTARYCAGHSSGRGEVVVVEFRPPLRCVDDPFLVLKKEYYGGSRCYFLWDDRFWIPMVIDDDEL